jgi:hypothetical protein
MAPEYTAEHTAAEQRWLRELDRNSSAAARVSLTRGYQQRGRCQRELASPEIKVLDKAPRLARGGKRTLVPRTQRGLPPTPEHIPNESEHRAARPQVGPTRPLELYAI